MTSPQPVLNFLIWVMTGPLRECESVEVWLINFYLMIVFPHAIGLDWATYWVRDIFLVLKLIKKLVRIACHWLVNPAAD